MGSVEATKFLHNREGVRTVVHTSSTTSSSVLIRHESESSISSFCSVATQFPLSPQRCFDRSFRSFDTYVAVVS